MDSIITKKKVCYFCGSPYDLQTHHCVFGRFRKLADQYGLTVPLCAECHYEVHQHNEQAVYLKKIAQEAFDKEYGEGEFQRVFGVNFLD